MQPEQVIGLLILIIFGIGTALMVTRKLPALLTLPIMGIAIAGSAWAVQHLMQVPEAGRIEIHDVLGGVVGGGAVRLHTAMIVAFFGGMLSFLMQKSGTAESLVKQGAELIGDNPLGVAIFSMLLIALLFTSIGGLGALIMVAMVVLPMLATVGIQPVVAGGIMLIGISLGGILNAGNWVLYTTSPYDLEISQIKSFAVVLFFLTGIAGIVFICVELLRSGTLRSKKPVIVTLVFSVLLGTGLTVLLSLFDFSGRGESGAAGLIVRWGIGIALGVIVLIVLLDIRRRVRRWRHQIVTIKWYAYLIPVVPLLLIAVYGVDPLAAFLIAFAYGILVTARPGSVSLTIQSMIQGASTVIPAVMLMVGIGILIQSVLGPSGWSAANEGAAWPVLASIQPFFQKISLPTPFHYVLVFGLCAPLALYRGPLNVWGLGFGVGAIIIASGSVPPLAVMAMLLTVGQVQGICDPTNTSNVWLANELRVDVQALMWRTLPYIWGMVFVGLTVAAIIAYR